MSLELSLFTNFPESLREKNVIPYIYLLWNLNFITAHLGKDSSHYIFQ